MERATWGHTASYEVKDRDRVCLNPQSRSSPLNTLQRSLGRVSSSQNWETAVISGLDLGSLGWSGFGVGNWG